METESAGVKPPTSSQKKPIERKNIHIVCQELEPTAVGGTLAHLCRFQIFVIATQMNTWFMCTDQLLYPGQRFNVFRMGFGEEFEEVGIGCWRILKTGL